MMLEPAITAIVMGIILFVLGLVPGPLAAVKEGIENLNFGDAPRKKETPAGTGGERLAGQEWLAVAGLVLATMGILVLIAY
jgi:hypothetical protein